MPFRHHQVGRESPSATGLGTTTPLLSGAGYRICRTGLLTTIFHGQGASNVGCRRTHAARPALSRPAPIYRKHGPDELPQMHAKGGQHPDRQSAPATQGAPRSQSQHRRRHRSYPRPVQMRHQRWARKLASAAACASTTKTLGTVRLQPSARKVRTPGQGFLHLVVGAPKTGQGLPRKPGGCGLEIRQNARPEQRNGNSAARARRRSTPPSSWHHHHQRRRAVESSQHGLPEAISTTPMSFGRLRQRDPRCGAWKYQALLAQARGHQSVRAGSRAVAGGKQL